MSVDHSETIRPGNAVARHPVVAYFVAAFAISWAGALIVAAPHLVRHEPLPKLTGIVMFPVMLLGPSVAGIALARLVDGPRGVRELFSRVARWRFAARWYAALLIPPALVLSVLVCLRALVSPAYTPNFFWMGVLFGVPAGLLEEIGWTGYAYPKMRSSRNPLFAAILLGVLWGCWHLPVVNFLGAAVPHGAYWLPFFGAFTVAMTAIRALICWLYSNTKSVLLAQLMHISSTGSLVVFSAPLVSPRQEVFWYLIYAATLWAIVLAVVMIFSSRLNRRIPCSAPIRSRATRL